MILPALDNVNSKQAVSTKEKLEAARQRSISYFLSMSFAEMCGYYFQHSLDELVNYKAEILSNRYSLKIFRNRNPFHWICIRNN